MTSESKGWSLEGSMVRGPKGQTWAHHRLLLQSLFRVLLEGREPKSSALGSHKL